MKSNINPSYRNQKFLIKKYKKNYNISGQTKITLEMVLAHWELEKELTKRLMNSNKLNRQNIFISCYTELYSKLYWLNKAVINENNIKTRRLDIWNQIAGDPPKRIYEIGSGKGELITYFASLGFDCTATEITSERGEKLVNSGSKVRWHTTDGVNFGLFEENNFYDIILSDQVVEHLHPDDISDHFKSAFHILKKEGIYVFQTPHSFLGPKDISRVFNCDKPIGMHLKEYTYKEILEVLNNAGFNKIEAVIKLPQKISNILPSLTFKPSHYFFRYLKFVELLLSYIKIILIRRTLAKVFRIILFQDIFLIAKKN